MGCEDVPPGFPYPGTLSQEVGAGPLLIGVSGGVDSMVLLSLLYSFLGDRLVVCHVNHGLRGEASDGDEVFVCGCAEELGVPFVSCRGDVADKAMNEKISVELAAREFRYDCFCRWAGEYGASLLFLAHHANDQSETVLFNLCRGSAGLAGIKGVSEFRGLRLVRPLLGVTRNDILAYARRKGIIWREDATNVQPVAVRNRMRAEVMPALERIMGRDVVGKLSQAARLAGEKEAALLEAVENMSLLDPQGRLFLPGVQVCGRELRRVILHWYLEKNSVSGISEAMVSSAEGLLDLCSPSRIMLPGGRLLRRKAQRLFVE